MYISNLTSPAKVFVDSAFLINKQTANLLPYLHGTTENDLLFVKLTFSGINSTQKIGKVLFNVYCENVFYDTTAKLIKCDSTNLNPSTMTGIAQSMTGDEEVVDKVLSRGTGDSGNQGDGKCIFTFDITKLVRGLSNNSSIMFAINFNSISNSELIVHSPQKYGENNEVCTITTAEVTGLNSMYKYDEHDLGQAGRVSINLFNGKPTYSTSLVTSLSKKIPISFGLYQFRDNEDGISHFKNKVVPNFHYRIYTLNEEYVIEDPSGFQNYYRKISSNYSSEKLKTKYGVKHKISNYDLYHSPYDYSYFYLKEINGVKTIELYDQQDTLTKFEVDTSSAKIKKVTTSLGYTLTYTWNGNRLQSIKNNDGDNMLVDYVEPGYISKISFPEMNRYISFVQTDELLNVEVYYEKTTDGVTTKDVIKNFRLRFSSNKLTHVYDDIMEQYLYLIYDSIGRISSAGLYNQTATEKAYLIDYSYSHNYTKTKDLDDNELYYHFDMYGRVKTIMDKYARTVTYNYAEVEDGISKNKTAASKIQTNSRNLLDNASFENEDLTSNGSPVWYKNAEAAGNFEVVIGGALSQKCLKVDSVSSETIIITQDVIKPSTGSYSLSGFIKHPTLTNLSSSNVIVKVCGTYQVDETVITQVNSTTTETEIVTVTKSFEAKATLDFDRTDWYHFKTSKVTIPTDARNIKMSVKLTIANVKTTVYIDDFQLTDAKFSTRHNLIENGYMEFFDSEGRPYGWEFVNFESEDQVSTSLFYKFLGLDAYYNILGDYAMRIAPGNSLVDGATNTYKKKKMYKTINIQGLAGEQFVYSVLGYADVTDNVIFRTFITFSYENKGDKTYTFDFDKNFSNWQMLTRDITTEDNYSKVVVGVEYDGGVEACFDCFQLYKDAFGKYYNYDNYGKLIETITEGGNASKIIYNDDNQVEEIYSSDGSHFKYTYVDGLLVSALDLYGNLVEFEYDDKNRVVKQTITADGETLETSTIYDDVNNTETSIDEFGKSSIVALDYLKRVSSHTSPLAQQTDFTYNNKLQLTRIKSVLGSTTHRNDFTYNSKANTEKIVCYGGAEYTLVYDVLNRITAVKCNGNTFESYEFDPLVDGYSKGNLVRKTVDGTGDYYQFEYNDDGEVIKYKLNGNVLATYEYDDTGNLYELCDVKNGITYYYEYDLNGKLLKEITSNGKRTSYTYDNLGNIQKKIYNINNLVRCIDYEYDYETNEYSKEGYFSRIANTFGDELIIADRSQFGSPIFVSSYNKVFDNESKMEVVRFLNYSSKIMYKLSEANRYRDNYEEWKRNFYYNKTFYAWVKPTAYISTQDYYKTNLMSFSRIVETNTEDILSYLAISDTGNLIYYSANSEPTITSSGMIEFDKWNLVGIQFSKPIGQDSSQARLILNGVVTDVFTINENVGEINLLTLANNLNLTQLAAHLHTTLYFASTVIGAYSYTDEDFRIIYNEGKKYFSNYQINRINGTSYYNEHIYDGFDVITLNGSLESSKEYRPYKITEIDSSYRFEKNKIFKYDEEIKRFVYASLIENTSIKKGNTPTLAYKLPLKDKGTITLRFKYQASTTQKCIFSAICNSSETLGIYITSAGKFKFVVNASNKSSSKVVEPDVWNNISIRYKAEKLQVYCNDVIVYSSTLTVSLTDSIIYLGNSVSTDKPLNGYLEMFAYATKFVVNAIKTGIATNGMITSVRNKVDNLGRLSENTITVNGNNFVTSYVYNKTRVTTQTLPNNDTISYTYNDVGQVISKTFNSGTSLSTVSYTYDKLGRLTEEVYEDGTVHRYTYVKSGDIVNYKKYENNVKVDDIQFLYSNNKLSMVVNNMTGHVLQETGYSSSNAGFYPLRFVLDGQMLNLIWEGKRLKQIGNNIIYTYNSQGIRIKKETPNETTTFVLEGSNIISMDKTVDEQTYRLDFVYDSNNQIVGLNTEEGQYFYIKDITGNIIGLIDSTGSFVVKYKYNAWGKLLDKLIITACIASEHNPFIYKGYYYDVETGLFWCNSRYYNPEWGRWISPDSIEYLDPQSINGLNLYAYCGNDPISFCDPSGHFAVSTFLIGLAASWVISSIASYYLGEHLVSGVSSVYGGVQTIATGISLLAYGPVGWVLGGAAIALGAVNIAFGTAEFQQHFTGNNWINDIGITGDLYTGLYIGSSIASAAVSIGGTYYKTTTHGQIAYNAKYWDKGTFKNSRASLKYHYAKHGNGLTPTQYTQSALDFSAFNSSSFKYTYNYNYKNASWYFNNMYGVGGYFTSSGQIITFWF